MFSMAIGRSQGGQFFCIMSNNSIKYIRFLFSLQIYIYSAFLKIKNKVDIEVIDFNGRNVLHIAANACDDPVVVLLLLARGADPLAKSYVGDLPSDYAKFQKHTKIEALLTEASKVVNTVHDK
jgi:ankyrin repeat protein